MKKSWEELMTSMRKAQGGEFQDDEDEVIIVDKEDGDEDFEDVDDEDVEATEDEDAEFVDATGDLKKTNESIGQIKDVLLDAVARLDSIGATQKALQKSQNRIMQKLQMPLPKKSATGAADLPPEVLEKSQSGGATRHKPFTQETFLQARQLLLDNKVDYESTSIACSQMQKSMHDPKFQISQKYIDLITKLADKK
ncbi:MAG: hypothetical protein Ta2A_07050 [Treponemataceae bacterium]|nr:MAG: hypothetical protein Ta2A_07050 [Treponemataceae bacterium]